MILKAKERGDGGQLARYLLATRDNDHVELHEISGFISDGLVEAFHEADAIASGTRCKNYLFSMSLNPPEGVYVETDVFERAADQIGTKLGLENQPRAIVFHEKNGRRHAHVVWSRIDTESMRALNLPHYKTKLRDISRELYLEHGWDLPSVLEVQAEIAERMSRKLEVFIADAEKEATQRMAMLDFRKGEMVARHRDERSRLWAVQEKRWLAETNERSQRLPRGFSGIWQRLTGQYGKIKALNELEMLKAWQRDREQKDEMIFKQLQERDTLQHDIKRQRMIASQELMQLRKDVANFQEVDRPDPERSRKDEERRRSRDRPRRPLGP